MRTWIVVGGLSCCVALTACGPATDGDSGTGEGSGTAAATGGEASTGGGATTGGQTETGGGGTATGGTDTGAPTTSHGTGTDCPPPTGALVGITLAGRDDVSDLVLDLSCAVSSVTEPADDTVAIALVECTDQGGGAVDDVVLTLTSDPPSPPLVEPGAQVRLHYEREVRFAGGQWLTLRSDPGEMLLVAGIDGSELHPLAGEMDYAPLDIQIEDGLCTPVPDENACADIERVAIAVTYDGMTTSVIDDSHGFVGQLTSYAIVVDEATVLHDIQCPGPPGAVLRALFVALMEG